MAAALGSITLSSGTAVAVNISTVASASGVTKTGVQYSQKAGTLYGTWTSFTTTYITVAGSISVTPLTVGSTYKFRAVGVNNSNIFISGSESSESTDVTMVATPAAPTITANNGSMSVAFSTSVTGATTYTIQRDTITGFSAPTTVATGWTSSPYVDNTVLTKGASYFYRIIGIASNNTVSANGPSSAAAVYATVPDAPTATTAAATSISAVTVNWDAPVSTGGSAITYYKVNYSTANSTDTSTWPLASATIASTLRTFSVPGLAAGTSYYFRVSAINARGTSLASNSLQCSTLAAAPTAVVSSYVDSTDAATTGNSASGTKMSVSFTAPTGIAITGYTVISSVGGLTATGTSSPIVISGLTQGTSYTFTVKAATKNSSSVDQLSAASSASVARTAALAPGNMSTITVGTRTITTTPLSWTAVAGNGLTTNYKIERYDASSPTPTWSTIVTSQTAVIYPGSTLITNNQYTWRVTPFTAAGSGATSNEVTAWTLPNNSIQPTALALKPESSTSILVSTTASAILGQNYYIIPYLNGVTAQNGLGDTTDLRVTHTGTGVPISNIEVPNLTAGASYKFATQSYNSNETVAVSALSTASIVPGIVPGLPQGTLVASAQTSSAITINGFSKPSDFGSYADITGYVVDRSLNGTTWTNASSAVAATATSYAFSGLVANTSYWLRIAAKNASGTGAYRYLVTSGDDTVAPAPAPAPAPTGTLPATPATPVATFTSFTGDDSMNISVVFTSVNGATYKIIPYRDGTEEVAGSIQQVTASSASTTVAFASLPGYTSYRFCVQYIGAYGNANSAYSNVIVPYTEPPTVTKAPSGKSYRLYAPNYKEIYWFSYADLNIADAYFGLTILADGSAAWSVTDTRTGLTDKFRGQRSVIFGSSPNAGGNTGPRVVFHGGGSNNTDLEYSYTSTWEPASGLIQVTTTGIAAANGSMLLFAAGETFTRTTPSTWQLDRALTFKTIGDIAANGKATIFIPNWASSTWNINCIASNIMMEDIIIDGNNTIRNSVLFKCAHPTTPFSLIENFTFNRVEFKRFGSRGLDFHYVKNVTFDGCKIDEVTSAATVVLTSCKNVVVKNSEIACSSGGTFSILTTDGPNYLWNNNTSALWSATEAERLDALNNKNIDLTLNNLFPGPVGTYTKNPNNVSYIDINLFRLATVGGRLGKPANVTDLTNDNSHYQVSLPSTELKLPAGKFVVEYANGYSSYPTFNYPYKNFADSTNYSNGTVRTSQFGAGAVTVTSGGARIYPAGYEVAPGVPSVTADRHADGGRVDLSWTAVVANADSGMHSTEPYTVTVSPSAGTIVYGYLSASVTGLTNGEEYTFTVTAQNAANLTSTSSPVSATPAYTPLTPAICFLGNTPIQTPTGYRRIDRLRVGDKVMTADGRTVAIQRIFKKNYEPSVAVNPYVIPKGQFGATENVMISPEHRVAVSGRGLVEARNLGLKQMSMRAAFDYYNLELPTWESDNMVAAGVEVESLAPVRRLEITKAEFTALLKAKYGRITPDVIARATRTCFFTAEGKVNIPVIKRKNDSTHH